MNQQFEDVFDNILWCLIIIVVRNTISGVYINQINVLKD